MPNQFNLPDLGEGLTEAEIVQVLVAEGEEIREDQPVFLVETEKAQVELPSPFGGRIGKVHVKPGQRVKVGAPLLTFEPSTPAGSVAEPRVGGVEGSVAEPRVGGAGGDSLPPPARTTAAARSLAEPRVGGAGGGSLSPPARILPPAATPATRRLARELGVELTAVTGSGPGGRITDDDVRRASGRRGTTRPAAPAIGRGARAPEAIGPAPRVEEPAASVAEPGAGEVAEAGISAAIRKPLPRFEQWGPVERERLVGVRRRSAEHLALAWSLIPHVTQHDEADITELEALRRRHQARVAEWGGDLTLTVLLVKAAAILLRAHPRFNASLDDQAAELITKRYYHIGVAVDTPNGLVVPVVRDADRKPVRVLAVELSELVARTRDGKATLEELRGGTFTITNTGALGGTAATPIINYPEVAILGVGRARPRPVVRDGQVAVRLILPLSLAFDHRVIDGMEAARFSTDLVRLLEDPERLLLEG